VLRYELKLASLISVKISQKNKVNLFNQIDKFKTSDGCYQQLPTDKYSIRNKSMTNLYSTYLTSEINLRSNATSIQINDLWIKKCENTFGGFGIVPNSHSRLEYTFYALKLLKNLDKITKISAKRHISWIINCYQDFIYFADRKNSKPNLKDNFYALKSLQILSAVSKITNPDEFSISCEELWIKGKRTEGDTYYFICCLAILGTLSKRVIENITLFWITLYRRIIINTRIDKHVIKIFHYLSILKDLKIEDDDLVNKIKSEFLKSELLNWREEGSI